MSVISVLKALHILPIWCDNKYTDKGRLDFEGRGVLGSASLYK